jgi:hypothetical protein
VGNYCFRHHIADHLIGKCTTVVFAKAFRALAERAILISAIDEPANTPATRKAVGSKEWSNASLIFWSEASGLNSVAPSSVR